MVIIILDVFHIHNVLFIAIVFSSKKKNYLSFVSYIYIYGLFIYAFPIAFCVFFPSNLFSFLQFKKY